MQTANPKTAQTIHGGNTPTNKHTEETGLLAAHQEAENALSMALYYLRTGAGNVPGAMRKAVQALGALNTLQIAGAGRASQIGGAA